MNKEYEKHIGAMQNHYSTLFDELVDEVWEKSGHPLSEFPEVKKVRDIDCLRKDVEARQRSRFPCESRFPYFYCISQGTFNHDNTSYETFVGSTKQSPLAIAVVDKFDERLTRTRLRQTLLNILIWGGDTILHQGEPIEGITRTSILTTNKGESQLMIVPYILWSECTISQSKWDRKWDRLKKEAFDRNKKGLKSLAKVAEIYTKITKTSEFEDEEGALYFAQRSIVDLFINTDPREVKQALQSIRTSSILGEQGK